MRIRVSRRVDFNAYTRTIAQLEGFGIKEADLPVGFYIMHWSERRRYIMSRYRLYVCPRCRRVVAPDEKHLNKQLCVRCGNNTQHRIDFSDSEEGLLTSHPAAHVGISKSDLPTITGMRSSIVHDVLSKLAKGKTR